MVMLLLRRIIFPKLTWDAALVVSWYLESLVLSGITCLVPHWVGQLCYEDSLSTQCMCDSSAQCQMGSELSQSLGSCGCSVLGSECVCVLCCVQEFLICGLLVSQVSGKLVHPLMSWIRQLIV